MFMNAVPVEVTATTKMTINITADEAWRILCQALGMKFIYEDDRDYYLAVLDEELGDFDPYYEQPCVCYIDENGEEKIASDCGNEFAALCTLAAHMFPNTSFRGAPYIYRYDPEKEEK